MDHQSSCTPLSYTPGVYTMHVTGVSAMHVKLEWSSNLMCHKVCYNWNCLPLKIEWGCFVWVGKLLISRK